MAKHLIGIYPMRILPLVFSTLVVISLVNDGTASFSGGY